MSRFVISGAGGGSPSRLEINDFVKQEQQFSLYIQALQSMSSRDQGDITSFFQVGGIHGLPYVPWDGSTGPKPFDPRRQWGGYCVHGSVLFPTWHRPYLMLYEQILNKRAQEIAAKYTVNTDSWKKAAVDLRQPYWDWAKNSTPPAEVISLQKVTITTPNGQRTAVDNPLVRYNFHPIDPSFGAPYSQWRTTLRHPTTDGSDATADVTRLRSVLRNNQSSITRATFNMLTRVHTWPAFSSHTVGDGGSSSNSLEAIHDNVHGYVGGGGHMSDPAVAAFDPIFFLHHCNVDRMLSLWSALNPGVWVSRGDAENGSFTMTAEVPVDQTTPLTPFWKEQTSFWTSSAVTDTTKLGYTYPEFKGLDMGNAAAVRQAISVAISRLYGGGLFGILANVQPTASFMAVSSAAVVEAKTPIVGTSAPKKDEPSAAKPTGAEALGIAALGAIPHALAAPHHALVHAASPSVNTVEGQNLWEWTARVEFKKYELGSSFAVLLFLGQVPEDPNQWLVSHNIVGAHYAFVNTSAEQCANCRNNADIVTEGFVHLNDGIAAHSSLGSFDLEVIEPYLTQELNWRVQKINGEPAELQSLEVRVIATPLTLPPGAMFPVPGTARDCNGVTYGRPGGCRHA